MAASIANPDSSPAAPAPPVSFLAVGRRRCQAFHCLQFLRSVVLSAALGGALACGSDTGAPVQRTTAQLYWNLQLNQHAIVMALSAPYDTAQLIATPFNVEGAPLTGLGPVTFTSKDSSVVVSPTGLLTARYVTSAGPVFVVATLRDSTQGVTHRDTAFVVVTQRPASVGLATFSLQPAPGDSAKRGLGDGLFVPTAEPWPVTAIDSAGTTLCGSNGCSIPVYYHSSNTIVALINPHTGVVAKNDTGHVVLSAQTLYYGRPYHDTVTFRVGLMTETFLVVRAASAGGTFIPPKIVLGVGGNFIFWNQGVYGPVQITFSDATFAATSDFFPTGSGNIMFNCDSVTGNFGVDCPLFAGELQVRQFPQAGTVQIHITPFPGFPGQTIELDVVRE